MLDFKFSFNIFILIYYFMLISLEKFIKIFNFLFRRNKTIDIRERFITLIYFIYTILFLSGAEIFNKIIFFIFFLLTPYFKIAKPINNFLFQKKQQFRVFQKLNNNYDIFKENTDLKDEIIEYRRIIQFLNKENLFNLISKTNKKFEFIQFIEPININSNEYIFAKSRDLENIKINDIIINSDFHLIGKVTHIDKIFKILRIQLIESNKSAIPVIIKNSNIQGSININNNKSICELVFTLDVTDLKLKDQVQDNDIVTTSDLDEMINSDIIIGLIKKKNNILCIERLESFKKNNLFLIKNKFNLADVETNK